MAMGQIMARTGQQVVSEIREDLFRHTQGLPLSYFDGHTHGELMSRFTNDVDTISEALNNSFTTLIQSFFYDCRNNYLYHSSEFLSCH